MCFLLHPKDIPCKHFKCKSSSLDIHHYLATEYVWATKFRLILFFWGDNSALHVLFLVNDIIGKFNPRVN